MDNAGYPLDIHPFLASSCHFKLICFRIIKLFGNRASADPSVTVYCAVRITAVFTSSLSGVYLILAMTFDRFYGIIKPHKASSFNTVRRAKITCFIIILVCTLFNIPHMFLYIDKGYLCIPYAKHMEPLRGEFYYWLSFVVNYSFPFVALLIMNSFIIHTIRFRKNLGSTDKIDKKLKTSERQIFMILLLVTFSFLLLTTPAYMFFLFSMIIDFGQSPKHQADLQLFFSAAQKTWYANNGINFFLYILSGTKFRKDFINLFQRCSRSKMSTNQRPSMNTLSSINSCHHRQGYLCPEWICWMYFFLSDCRIRTC